MISEQQYRPPEATEAEAAKNPDYVREQAKQYAEGKTGNLGERQQIYNRSFEYGKKAPELGRQLASTYDFLNVPTEGIKTGETTVETVKAAFITEMNDRIASRLENQETKQVKAKFFIENITEHALAVALSDPELTPEEKAQKVENALQLASMAVEAIAKQDVAANAVTLGDHGWNHLVQDLRDSRILAAGLKEGDEGLNANEELILSLAAAFHDIGYSSPEVSDHQQLDSANYGLDKGHPLLSFTFVRQNQEKFRAVLSEEDYQALCTIIVNHENPERADQAGPNYEHLSKAFAHADAAASVGVEKVPPMIAQVPDVIRYAYLLNQGDAAVKSGLITEEQYQELKAKAKADVQNILTSGGYDEEQAKQLLNVFTDTHLTAKSLKFVLGRLTGEMGDIQVATTGEGKKVALAMNLGEAQTIENFLPGAVNAGAKLAVKVFGEQAGIHLSDEQSSSLMEFMLTDNGSPPLNFEEIGVRATRQGDSVLLESPSVQLMYNPNEQAREQRQFYDKIVAALNQGKQELAEATAVAFAQVQSRSNEAQEVPETPGAPIQTQVV